MTEPTTLIYVNGVVFPGGGSRAAEPAAIVTQGDTIRHVGRLDRARAFDGHEIDLAGRLVTPSFVDAHLHTLQVGQVMAGLDLAGTPSLAALLSAVQQHAEYRSGQVIVGHGWDETRWPEERPPTRQELDRASGGAVVYLARVDVHSAVVSTALLERLPDVAAAVGFRPDGWLNREAHHQARDQLASLFTLADHEVNARLALNRAASLGIGTVHELGGAHLCSWEEMEVVRQVASEIGIDVVTYWGGFADDKTLSRARLAGVAGLAGDLCMDGAIGSRTAALHEPYSDLPEDAPDRRGALYLDEDQATAHIVACTRAGLQAGFHCIGDRGVATAVAGFRRAAAEVGPEAVRAVRHRLDHLEMCAEEDFAVLADLGVYASMQPTFDAWWGDPKGLYAQRLGDRSTAMNRLGSLHRAGVGLALGSDAPVTPLDGWGMVRDSVHHWQPTEQLTVHDAFAAATIGGHVAGLDDDSGVLAPGRPASFAVWDVDADELVDGLPVLHRGEPGPDCLRTVVRGRTVWDAAAVRAPL